MTLETSRAVETPKKRNAVTSNRMLIFNELQKHVIGRLAKHAEGPLNWNGRVHGLRDVT